METICARPASGKMVSMETKPELIASIAGLTARLIQRLGEEDADERAHMRGRCSPEARRALDQMSVEALHLLDAVPAAGEPESASVNIVGLARLTGAPKGTVSKRVQRLAELGVVERGRLQGNRKEVRLRLTDIGEEIRAAHRSLHAQMGELPEAFLDRYRPDELRTVARVLSDLVRMPRDGLRFRPDLLD